MILRDWLLCPLCESKTRVQIRSDTILENFSLYCPKCKRETVINVKQMVVTLSRVDDISNTNIRNSYQ